MALFTEDTHFVVYMNARDPTPSLEFHSREALAPVFADLNQYDATTHFVGQSTLYTLNDGRAIGETYCLAHHVTVDGHKRRLMVASLRYHDTFVKSDDAWLFAERQLYVDWLEERALSWHQPDISGERRYLKDRSRAMNSQSAGKKCLVIVGASGMIAICLTRFKMPFSEIAWRGSNQLKPIACGSGMRH